MTLPSAWPQAAPAPFHRPHGLTVGRIFARATRKAFVEDPVQSLVVPFLLLLPWSVLDGILPDPSVDEFTPVLGALWILSALGGLVTTLLVTAMLRFRLAAPLFGERISGIDAYGRGLGRLLALLLTEIVRSLAVAAAMVALIVPGVFLGYRLSVATEAAVLGGAGVGTAFQRSFALTAGRFSSWFRMLMATVLTWVLVLLPATAIYMAASVSFADLPESLLAAPTLPILLAIGQYAWTLYYLELRAQSAETAPPAVAQGGVVAPAAGDTPPFADDAVSKGDGATPAPVVEARLEGMP